MTEPVSDLIVFENR